MSTVTVFVDRRRLLGSGVLARLAGRGGEEQGGQGAEDVQGSAIHGSRLTRPDAGIV